MILPVALAVLGLVAIAGAELLARRLTPGFLLARTLAGARQVSIADALAIAARGEGRYVRVHGRISSDEEFPDENDRPLVYRRKRLETRRSDGRWQTAANDVEGVPFGVESRSSFIAVDGDALGPGLVVVPREARGAGADLPADLAAGVDPARPARLVVEQVSAVEHAHVAGVPRSSENGPVMSSGARRPLILTTLEIDDAMRLLGRERRWLAIALAVMPIAGLGLMLAAVVTLVLGVRG